MKKKKSNKQLEQLPNLHREICRNCSLTLGFEYPAPPLPVPITNVPELGANEASHEWPNSASSHKGLCQCPNPNVNVLWCPVQLYELLCQTVIPQHFSKCLQSRRLWEPTELSPGVITCKRLGIRADRSLMGRIQIKRCRIWHLDDTTIKKFKETENFLCKRKDWGAFLTLLHHHHLHRLRPKGAKHKFALEIHISSAAADQQSKL